MSKLKKLITLIREERLKISIKEFIRFKFYIPLLKKWNIIIDTYFGINTEIVVDISTFGFNESIGNRQESTPRRHLHIILSSLSISENDVFVDMGCGVGRVMAAAGMYPFKEIVGVDVSAELNDICESNIKKMKHRLKCKKYKNITSNASEYKIPRDATFIYFFNPFGKEVMKNVFEAILDSISQFPRKVTIIWYNPKYQQILEESFPLKIIKEYNWNNWGLFDSRCLLYEISSV